MGASRPIPPAASLRSLGATVRSMAAVITVQVLYAISARAAGTRAMTPSTRRTLGRSHGSDRGHSRRSACKLWGRR